MKHTDHCLVCNNSKFDFQKGTYCGLTDSKAKFGSICEKITFGETTLKRIEQLNFECELTKSKKLLSILNFVFFLIVACGVFSGGYYLWGVISGEGFFAMAPFIIMFIGLGIIPLATGPLRKYFSDRKNNNLKKRDLDTVLQKYGLQYKAIVHLKKQNHNILDVHVEVELLKNDKFFNKYSNRFDYNDNEKKMDNYSFGQLLDGIDSGF